MRKAHPLRKPRGNKLPSRVMFLQVDMEEKIDPPGESRRLVPTTINWIAARPGNHGWFTRYQTGQELHAASFWDSLETQMPAGTSLTIIAVDAYTAWTALGLWEKLDQGALVLRRKDYGYKQPKDNKRRARPGITCVLERPPFIVLIRNPKTGATATLLDVANFGVKVDDMPAPGEPVVKRMGRWFHDWLQTIVELKLGSFQSTLASQAFYGFKRSYMPCRIDVHDNETALWMERLAYYGGRCEPFKIGTIDGPIYQVDVRSMYSAVAAEFPVPTNLIGAFYPDKRADKYRLVALPGTIAACTFKLREPVLPWSPGREQALRSWMKDGLRAPLTTTITETVLYPIGTVTGVWTWPELKLALEYGTLTNVYWHASYTADIIGRDWAVTIDTARDKAKRLDMNAIAGMLKLATILVWGKFGQRGRRWLAEPDICRESNYDHWYQWNPATKALERYRAIAGDCQRLVEDGETGESCPSIAATITAGARVRLWELMIQAGRNNVYYVDTDSLWVNGNGLGLLGQLGSLVPNQLGRASVRSQHERLEILGPKSYIADDKRVCAGLRPDAEWIAPNRYQWQETESWLVPLSEQRLPEPILVERVGTADRRNGMSIVGADGWCRPHKLGE